MRFQSAANRKSYDEVAAFILNQCTQEFGLERFEGKQKVAGDSGTNREVDARGWFEDGTTFVIAQCKKHAGTGISQALTGSLAFSIIDPRAAGGFLVSPDGLRSGATQVAAAAGIQEIKLDPLSTTSAYFEEWLGSLRIGFTDDLNVEISEYLSIQRINKDGNVIQTNDSDKR